jgi:hypothetical protein
MDIQRIRRSQPGRPLTKIGGRTRRLACVRVFPVESGNGGRALRCDLRLDFGVDAGSPLAPIAWPSFFTLRKKRWAFRTDSASRAEAWTMILLVSFSIAKVFISIS